MVASAALIEQLTRLLRRRALAGSEREILPDAPLGETGLGLDSLAMVEFITTLEKHFQIEFPEHIWIDRAAFNLRRLAAAITELKGDTEIPMTTLAELQAVGAEQKSPEKAAFLPRTIRAVTRRILARDTFYILAFDLEKKSPPRFAATVDLQMRTAGEEIRPHLTELWDRKNSERKLGLFDQRLKSGFVCLTAWAGQHLAGIDWLSTTGDKEPITGLIVETGPGSCYGFDLHEHPQYHSRGVGMALLAYSVKVARDMGFKTQYTIVHAENRKMLMAAVQFFGFTRAGQINTRRLLEKPQSTWAVNGRSGKSPVLPL